MLRKMLCAGTIDQAMQDAAKDFQAAFIIASSTRSTHCRFWACPAGLNERQVDARRRVHETLQALGGISSPAGSCVWHVIGVQRSVREWAIRQGRNGRPNDQRQAQGTLIAALGTDTAFWTRPGQAGVVMVAIAGAPDLRRLQASSPMPKGSRIVHSQIIRFN
jgi:hypothetical protein